MNEILNNIITRRSVRSFVEGKKIPKEVLENIVTAGMFAPTAKNRQPVLFTVVANEQSIKKLAAAVGKAIGRDDYDFYRPEALIITSCDRESPFVKEDTSCALENMFLYAHSVGVGSVWINQLVGCCDDSNVRALLTEMDIPSNHALGGVAALGYPGDESEKDLTRKCKAHYIF